MKGATMYDYKVGVVIPIFNEEKNIPELLQRLTGVLSRTCNYEILFVNDGSSDESRKIIESYAKNDSRIKLINFSRNFGHQEAISAGIANIAGDAAILMDGDLQDPPEVLPQFIDKWQEGYQVVYAIRKKRKENIFKRAAYYIFYRTLGKLSDIDIPLDSGDFSCVDRVVIEHLNALPEKNRFVRGIRSWVGYKQVGLEYERDARKYGNPKFTFSKLLKLAYDGMISFSHKPIKIVAKLGLISLIFSLVIIIGTLYLKLFTNITIPGYSSTIIIISFFSGLQMLMMGVIGEYVARIFDEVKGRPNYIIESTLNLDENG